MLDSHRYIQLHLVNGITSQINCKFSSVNLRNNLLLAMANIGTGQFGRPRTGLARQYFTYDRDRNICICNVGDCRTELIVYEKFSNLLIF